MPQPPKRFFLATLSAISVPNRYLSLALVSMSVRETLKIHHTIAISFHSSISICCVLVTHVSLPYSIVLLKRMHIFLLSFRDPGHINRKDLDTARQAKGFSLSISIIYISHRGCCLHHHMVLYVQSTER